MNDLLLIGEVFGAVAVYVSLLLIREWWIAPQESPARPRGIDSPGGRP